MHTIFARRFTWTEFSPVRKPVSLQLDERQGVAGRHNPGVFRRIAPFGMIILISLYALFSPASGVPFLPPGFDKIGHFCLFAALAVTGRRANIYASGLGASLVVYAVVSEILQSILPINRDGDVWDAAVDLCGVAIGLWLFSRARRREHAPSGHADG